MATLAGNTVNDLKNLIDKFTQDPNNAPGILYAAVNKKGDLIFDHASGKLGADSSEPMTTESVMWIASCTKMITGIACMQLVEQGKMQLDDVDFVEKIAPVGDATSKDHLIWSGVAQDVV
jgi:CubicO group peptidase (beta-lactamase class C family)